MKARQSQLLGASLLSFVLGKTHAVPSINVALRTSFGAPPYLVELLETAAEENATAYFPLLDRIAAGYFDAASTDQELYTKFRALVQEEGHLSRPEDLSSFDFALSIHSTAPRIEAHYQYYNSSARQSVGETEACEAWIYVPFSGQKYCSPELEEASAKPLGQPGEELHQLPFDRILGDALSGKPAVLYADITSQSFRKFYNTVSVTAKTGQASLVVRYKPAEIGAREALTVSGYGVELALKRTDYIVIDDRLEDDMSEKESSTQAETTTLSEEDVSDLRPLSASELRGLGLKAASFVLGSEAPFGTLERLLQDFPKHSGVIAGTNVSDDFLAEHLANRELMLPAGFNALWINGVQIMARDIDAYSLLEHLRRERKMINGVRELGLAAPEAIDLLAHEAITAASASQEVQRYDWRDDMEGGGVIMWLNDIEKDKRYADWPGTINGFLQRTFPGQLPSVRRTLHHLVIPVDLADFADVELIVEGVQSFIRRKVPIRFGLMPVAGSSAESAAQAKILYYVLDSYGIGAALDYLERSLTGAGRKFGAPQEKYFQKAIEERQLRKGKTALSFQAISDDVDLAARLASSNAYLARLGLDAASPSILINGVPVAKTDEWLQAMSQRVGLDIRMVQQAIFKEEVTEESYLPNLFLAKVAPRRNALVVPQDDKELRHVDFGALKAQFAYLPALKSSPDTIERELVHVTILDDFDTLAGVTHWFEAYLFQQQHDNVELALLHVPGKDVDAEQRRQVQNGLDGRNTKEFMQTLWNDYHAMIPPTPEEAGARGADEDFAWRQESYQKIFEGLPFPNEADMRIGNALWSQYSDIVAAVGLTPGQKAVLVNGRVVGPIAPGAELTMDDFDSLLSYERKKRLLPAAIAIESMNLTEKASTPLAFARISNLIALSQVSDVPEGIFEAAPTMRMGAFKAWTTEHTAIKIGDPETANVQIYTSIDPASEVAQRWVSIIKALSELDGVYLCMFLNPKPHLSELPIKRFYRHVLDSKPTFSSTGALEGLSAKFSGLPADALLNMGMDLPPSWLVAPKDSVHDLDNIKLSAVKTGHDIEAVYELEHILIEGHSQSVTLGPPPRGAQLVLGTEFDSHFADTIIMANLGYFQFKANPGIYNLALQSGRSQEIFNLDSAGTVGYNDLPGDNGTEIALMSFRGATLFPHLSRKPGMEEEDVLEASSSKSALENLAEGADKLLAQAGLPNGEKLLSQAAKFGSNLFSSRKGSAGKDAISSSRHADINIFSVASGHLYERMLNIMMLSVMKHTRHTVKFWFIEQFLSPSFKDFLPVLAAEYGFKYEMVTYKWPHWLRGQKEKQREIWGYKILFLDVLFPLDLDKVIFVDADQIGRTDMFELVEHDLQGAPYGFTPMCDSRTEMEGFRFWKQGYWKNFLRGLPYHISALYVVDLKKFRSIAAGDRLRQQYHSLSADPASLSNLDQDLPNHMQMQLPIHSLPQEWLWCETWCSDEALKEAKTIDLCNNPQTKEPKLDRARRQVPEWTVYDDEIAGVVRRYKEGKVGGGVGGGEDVAGGDGEEGDESIQERLQREDAEKEEAKKTREGGHIRDEL